LLESVAETNCGRIWDGKIWTQDARAVFAHASSAPAKLMIQTRVCCLRFLPVASITTDLAPGWCISRRRGEFLAG